MWYSDSIKYYNKNIKYFVNVNGGVFLNLVETKGNLFSETYRKGDIYVHCISADFALGAGIAKQFREKFPIFTQEKQRMIQEFSCVSRFGLIPVVTEGYTIVNLVTKKNYWDKPTYDSLEVSLQSLQKYLVKYSQIRRILMPRIGCGLDRLSWNKVKIMLQDILRNVDVEVVVFYL